MMTTHEPAQTRSSTGTYRVDKEGINRRNKQKIKDDPDVHLFMGPLNQDIWRKWQEKSWLKN